MTIRRASVLLPCHGLDDFPTHLAGAEAAGLLAASTALWHPALLAAMGRLPGWRSTENLPDPDEFDGELVLMPWVSRQKLPIDWCDRMRASSPRNPPPVPANASREETIIAALESAGLDWPPHAALIVRDFLALGFAYLQVELLARSMRYSSILLADQFESAVIEAARAALAGDETLAREGLARAFDLLSDARNHTYSVDIYLIDLTLLANSTLGETLRSKLVAGLPTNVLVTGELLEKLSVEHPDSLANLRQAIESGTACIVGGMLHGESSALLAPEALLAEITQGQEATQRILNHNCEFFGQFNSAFSPHLPEVLTSSGFRAALLAAFDGGTLTKAEQCKTYWAPPQGPRIEALSAIPLDIAEPKTWLTLSSKMGDTIMHDHVATVLLAGWPGQGGEYHDDLRRVARQSPVLGKFITLEKYFRTTREPDEWTTFWPAERKHHIPADLSPESFSRFVKARRQEVANTHDCLRDGLTAIIHAVSADSANQVKSSGDAVVINPWSFESQRLIDTDPLELSVQDVASKTSQSQFVTAIPGCGFATLETVLPLPKPLASGRMLRNEALEVVISETTGGIQSLRAHRDRRTRTSQRIVFFDAQKSPNRVASPSGEAEPPRVDTQMIAERVAITRNDPVLGEITSSGRLLDAAGILLARFTQVVRLPRGMAAAFVSILLKPEHPPTGGIWSQYFASRLAWADETASLRCGAQWFYRDANGERIFSPEWVEISDGMNPITCFSFGLPLHRRASPTWLDTLLIGTADNQLFQFAVGLDCRFPTQMALALLTAGRPSTTKLQSQPNSNRGWFLHIGAKNVIVTHLEPLEGDRNGIRLRLLETAGHDVRTNVAAFRPFRSARQTNFRGQADGVLSIVEGEVRLEICSHRWLQIEAEW